MNVLSIDKLKGDLVNLKVTNERHIGGELPKVNANDKVTDSFANLLKEAIGSVNEMENKAIELTNQMAVNPESVDIHDVQIAAEEAEMAILFTKGVIDRAIRAYKEIINLR